MSVAPDMIFHTWATCFGEVCEVVVFYLDLLYSRERQSLDTVSVAPVVVISYSVIVPLRRLIPFSIGMSFRFFRIARVPRCFSSKL